MHIKIDDTVLVIAGDDRGVRGKVLRVDHQAGKIIVENVNNVYKHVRRSQKNPQGGRLSKEMPIQAGNVTPIPRILRSHPESASTSKHICVTM